MKTLKDKKKFGWDKPIKNRNCKKFGIQGRIKRDRCSLHRLLFHTEGWDQNNGEFDSIKWVIHDIKFYYDLYWNKGENLYDYITRYKYDKEGFWKTTDGRYYKTLFDHIEELYNTVKLREKL